MTGFARVQRARQQQMAELEEGPTGDRARAGVRNTLRQADYREGVSLLSPTGAGPTQMQRPVPVQQDADGGGTALVHEQAQRGLAGGGGSLPFLGQIQRSFGRHDVTNVQAHTDEMAQAASRALGARGFASGDRVGLGAGANLHTTAHEAAHVVQQRAGVSLSGGVGQVGDRYERHADSVADRVVQGCSAEGLLDCMASGGAGGASVQLDKADAQPLEGGDAKPKAQDPWAPSDEARVLFEQLAGTKDKEEIEKIVNELKAAGVSPKHIQEYITARKESVWLEIWQLLSKGKWVSVDEDGEVSWRFAIDSKEGLTWESAAVKIAAGKNSQGMGVTVVLHDIDGQSLTVVGGVDVNGDGFKGAGTEVTVKDDDGLGQTKVGAKYKRGVKTDQSHTGTVSVEHIGDTGDKIAVDGTGGVGKTGDPKGGGNVTWTKMKTVPVLDEEGKPELNEDGTPKTKQVVDYEVGGGGSYDSGTGGVSGDAHVKTEKLDVSGSGQGGGGTSEAKGAAELRPGDQLAVRLSGGWTRTRSTDEQPDKQVVKAGGGVDVGDVKGAGVEYTNTQQGATIHNFKAFVGEIPLGEYTKESKKTLGLKGEVDLGDLTTWNVETTLTLVDGADELKITGKFGEAKISDVNALSKLNVTGDDKAGFAEIGVVRKDGDTTYTADAHVLANENIFGIGGMMGFTHGDEKEGQHAASFLYHAMKEDKFAHYAEAAYKYLEDDFSIGATASITVKPGDKGYDKLWKLQTEVGFAVAKGQTLKFSCGVTGEGRRVAFTAGAEWDWTGVLNIKLNASIDPDDPSQIQSLLMFTPGGKDAPLSFIVGTNQDVGGGDIQHTFVEDKVNGADFFVGIRVDL